jgi:hypothetical protein
MKKWVNDQQIILEKEMIEHAAKTMQEDIDREILWGMLTGIGWTRIMLPGLIDNNHAIDITHWLASNCKGNFERRGRDFLFENPNDASYFILRWV